MISRTDIFDSISNAVTTYKPTTYVTSTYERTPTSFPCVMVIPLDRTRPIRNINLDGSDNQRRLTYEIQIVSNKKGRAQSEAWGLMDTVDTAFKSLYFISDMTTPIEEASDNYRIVARFHRQLGGGETI